MEIQMPTVKEFLEALPKDFTKKDMKPSEIESFVDTDEVQEIIRDEVSKLSRAGGPSNAGPAF